MQFQIIRPMKLEQSMFLMESVTIFQTGKQIEFFFLFFNHLLYDDLVTLEDWSVNLSAEIGILIIKMKFSFFFVRILSESSESKEQQSQLQNKPPKPSESVEAAEPSSVSTIVCVCVQSV